ncbi:MAG: DUF6455 family protein [Halocynthiibacter sp.]
MNWLSKYDRHTALVGRMAERLGLDLDDMMQRGQMRPEELREIILRCVGCPDPTGCEGWLASREAVVSEHTPRAPAFCRNKAKLDGMRKRHLH